MLKLLSWSNPAIAAPLPCQTSQPQCLEQLTQAAIAHNLELKTIDQRLSATTQRIGQQRRGKWKTWVQPNPIGIVANVLGGGDAQRVELAIADLELQVDELRRRRSQVETETRGQVLGLVLELEKLDRGIEEMRSAQVLNGQRLAIVEAGYRFGRGSTVEMMALWQAAEVEKGKIREEIFGREQVVRRLVGVTGFEAVQDFNLTR